MDSFTFDDFFEQERPQRSGRSKPVKRRWREIEAIKERQRLQKELQDIDILSDVDEKDVDF